MFTERSEPLNKIIGRPLCISKDTQILRFFILNNVYINMFSGKKGKEYIQINRFLFMGKLRISEWLIMKIYNSTLRN